MAFPGGSEGKESAYGAEDPGSIPGLVRSPGKENDNPLQYSYLENSMGKRSLAGYSPWGCKELDMTEQLTHTHTHTHKRQGSQQRPPIIGFTQTQMLW